jgi:lipoprotein-releasing system ATP-binding protein
MNSFFALKIGSRKGPSPTAGPHVPFAEQELPEQLITKDTSVTTYAAVETLEADPRIPTADSFLMESLGKTHRVDLPASELLAASDLVKSYRKGRHLVPVLLGVDLKISDKEFVAIEGQSGSGKSTLLHLLGTLDAPDGGEIHFEGRRIDNLPIRHRDRLRNRAFGMIFQFYHLLPELSALENVLMPIMIAEGTLGYWRSKQKHVERAKSLLEMVGLSHRLTHKPYELSGGEMQRAAIARALIARPQVLLADEPTGNLDRKNGEEILRILRTLNQQENVTIVMVTHDHGLARQADRIVRLAEGRVQQAG